LADLTGDCFVDLADFAVMAGRWLTGDRTPLDMVFIPGGSFQMGDSFNEGLPDERPVHTVTLNSFYVGRFEITNGQYCEFLNSAFLAGMLTIIDGVVYRADSGVSCPYCATSAAPNSNSQIVCGADVFWVRTKYGRDMSNDPMVQVTWYGAAAYCNWRSEQEGRQPCYDLSTWGCDFAEDGYHLPTEAQWEYAARGALQGRRFPWWDTIDHDHANFRSSRGIYSYDTNTAVNGVYHPTWNDDIFPYTSLVGSFHPNGYGLYDVAGNVSEWCNDYYGSYSPLPQADPFGPPTGLYHVYRGGGWCDGAMPCRVAYRGEERADFSDGALGFRVSLEAD